MLVICEVCGYEMFDLCGNLMVVVWVFLVDGNEGYVVVLFGVFIGVWEVVEFCDGN